MFHNTYDKVLQTRNFGNIMLVGLDLDGTCIETNEVFEAARCELIGFLRKAGIQPARLEAARRELDRIEKDKIRKHGYGLAACANAYIETAARCLGSLTFDQIESINAIVQDIETAPRKIFSDFHAFNDRMNALGADVVIITLGNDRHQQAKIDMLRAALPNFCVKYDHVVQSKTPREYKHLLRYHRETPESFIHIGDSVESDVMPVLAIGGDPVLIAREGQLRWSLDAASRPDASRPYKVVSSLEAAADHVENRYRTAGLVPPAAAVPGLPSPRP